MGLIYSSADSSQLITALKTNISSTKETINQLKSGSQKVVEAVDGRTLAGAAYTAGKGLFSELIIPTIGRVTTAFDQLEQELNTYQSADNVIRDEGSYLDEDILKEKIEAKKAQKIAALTSVSTLTNQIRLAESPEMSSYIQNTQREMNQLAESLDDEILQLEKKIEALYTFSSSTDGLFSNSLNDLNIAMQGVTVLNKTIVIDTGNYILPQGVDMNIFSNQNAENILINQKKRKKEFLKKYEIKKYINADGSVSWYLYKDGKRLSRSQNEKAYATLENIKDNLTEKEYTEGKLKVKKYEISFLPGVGPIGSIGKIGKGMLTIGKGLNILDKVNRIDIMNSEESEFKKSKKDGTPSKKHKTLEIGERNLPADGEPNSSTDLLNPDGSVKRRRYYGPDGKALEDIDYNHSDDGTHEFPHRHKWDWSKNPPRQKP